MVDGSIGVSFQPGQSSQGPNGNRRAQGAGGFQEAIKVLSLRLPKVVGAQASVPMPLLTSQGSGGNPRVDSVVNQVLRRLMPQGQPQGQPAAPVMPTGAPSFSGEATTRPMTPSWPMPQQPPSYPRPPHVVIDSPFGQPPRWPGQPQFDGGGGAPNAMIGELPLPYTIPGNPIPERPLPAPSVPSSPTPDPLAGFPDRYEI